MVGPDPSKSAGWLETVRTGLWFPDGDTQWEYDDGKGWATDPSTRIKIV